MKQGVRWGVRGVAGWAALVLLARCGGETPSEAADNARCQESSAVEPRRVYVAPTDDAYVEEGQEQPVSGAERKLVADNLSRRSAFLRFEVPTPPGPVRQATLRLYAMDGSSDGPRLYPATTDWSEDSVTWSQRPSVMGPPLGDVGEVPHGSSVEYDVTSFVQGGGTYGFALVNESRNGVDFASKEHVRLEWAPRLVLSVDAPASGDCAANP
ncbi:MAG TPA: DNRLRE domain-containing protein [Archangium sp.]|uniref:CBM96 family carbohydrate-binding protein n=1 Tax=Archangium sp. TaxID=1872627 RepID=UPI002E3048F1|nr:DNRLRE domain-containing protein [Archangium sp.]HEX5753291.1 DNRLRE domain-containing protein [Archangium sp.]